MSTDRELEGASGNQAGALLRCVQEALEAGADEEQLAMALCACLRRTPGVSGCAAYLEGRLLASSPQWSSESGAGAVLPLAADDPSLGSLHLAVSDPVAFDAYEAYAAAAIQLVGLRIRNLRQERRMRALEEQARAGDQRYRILVDNSSDAVLLASEDGSITYANPAACSMFSFKEDEFRGLNYAALAGPAENRVHAAMEERRRTGYWSGELQLVRKDGTAFPAQVYSATLTDPAGVKLAGIFIHDITRDKRAHSELMHRHELMSYVIEHMWSAVAVLDRELRHVYVSQRFLEEVGAKGLDVIGKRHYEVFPDIPEAWKEVHRRALQGEVLRAEADHFSRSDGSVYWTRWECRPWYEADGSIGGIVLYTEVINERIKAEEERRKLEAQLAQAQKMESIGRLAGGVAHDFNNLLTVINGYSQMALERLAKDDPLRPEIEEIQRSGERAAALTRQLLAFSRKQISPPRLLDVNDTVREMEPMLQRLVGERIRVRVSLHPGRLAILANPHQVEQALMNLAVNARDAMPRGGELRIETSIVQLDEAAARLQPDAKPGAYAVLSIADTGTGMDQETCQRIFEPFFTTKRPGQGTGLGLSTVHGIVAQSHGFITVSTEPGRGATFQLHFPAAEGAPEKLEHKSEPVAGRGQETVLVVEDQEEVRKFVTEALKGYGYRVIACSSATEALDICGERKGAVDLVLTDVVMPDIGGPELASHVARLWPGTPVIFMSGYTGNAQEEQAVPEEAVFLQKPFSPAELAGKVRAAINSRHPGSLS